MRNKIRGFTLIECIIYISIVLILFSFTIGNINKNREKQIFLNEKRNISQFIRKVQQYSQYNKKEYIIDFQISEYKVHFSEENKEIIDTLLISNNISYMTNNKNKNENFQRKTTNEGNFEKGFSIFLLNKKGDKIFYKISTNTINSLKYPIISIYKAKKPININEDYQKVNLWEEEL